MRWSKSEHSDPARCDCAGAKKAIEQLKPLKPVQAQRLEQQHTESCSWLTGACAGR